MNETLCLNGPALGDTGDVLASIRRLIASDNATTRARSFAQMPAAAGRDILLPCAMGKDCVRPAMTPAPDHLPAGATARAAADRIHDTAGRIDAAGGPDQAPLRLNPEAMIADAAGCPARRLRLPQGFPPAGQAQAPLPQDKGLAATQDAGHAPPVPLEMPRNAAVLAAGDPAQAIREGAEAAAAGPDPDPRENEPHPTITPLDKETTMQAYPTGVVSPLHAESPMTGLADRCAHGHAAASAAEENPLRALLREVVREEFEGEMQRRLDDTLRGMIRSEIVVALTEALLRRPAA